MTLLLENTKLSNSKVLVANIVKSNYKLHQIIASLLFLKVKTVKYIL